MSPGQSEPSSPSRQRPSNQQPDKAVSTATPRESAYSDPLSGDLAWVLYYPTWTSIDTYIPAVKPYRSNLLNLPMPPNYDFRTLSSPPSTPLGDFFITLS